MGGPDLFVVCKNCQAEVSPYITECPYCGHRLRKRAPKIERDGRSGDARPKAPRRARSQQDKARAARPARTPRRARARRERDAFAARKPVVSIAIVLASAIFTILGKVLVFDPGDVIVGPEGDDLQRIALAPFFYFRTGYELVALGVIFLFGWLIERRHGWWATLAVFAICGLGGMAAQHYLEPGVFASGANSAALGLLCAWLVRDLLGRRRGDDDESDLLGVLVIAVVVILMPLAAEEAQPLATGAGGILGFLCGLPLARLRER